MKEEIESQKKKKFVKNENEKKRLKRMRRRKGFQTLYKYRPEGCTSAEEVKTMRTHGDSEHTHILKMRTHDLTRLDHAYAWSFRNLKKERDFWDADSPLHAYEWYIVRTHIENMPTHVLTEIENFESSLSVENLICLEWARS